MFLIEYNFSTTSRFNATSEDELSLRYLFFTGDLFFRDGNKVIILDWDWIPLFDFAICLSEISDSLQGGDVNQMEFEFTESDEWIRFQKDGEEILIQFSFTEETLVLKFVDFRNAVLKFYKNIIFDISARNNELNNNPAFLKYLNRAEKM